MAIVRPGDVTVRDGVAFTDAAAAGAYRAQWDSEATADHLRSAIAVPGGAVPDLDALTAKVTSLWSRIPAGRHVETLLDVGAGYGRMGLYLDHARGLTCDAYCAVDISETMLHRLLEYRSRFDVFHGAELHAICASADALPLEDESVDLAISSFVFLHMGKGFVGGALREIARVLKPGGSIVLDGAFPNRRNPTSYVPRLKPERNRKPNALKYWTRGEIEAALADSGLVERCGRLVVEASNYALLPKRLGPVPVPGARRVNELLGEPPPAPDFLAVIYSVYSTGAFS